MEDEFFNPDLIKRAAQVIFSRKAQATAHPKIYFNDIEVKTVNEHKHFVRFNLGS